MRGGASMVISAGEVLTCNYAEYEFDWFERRGLNPDQFQ